MRVKRLFDFDQILEIFKPKTQRVYGYYCLPVLAGDSLIGRVDLKADRKRGRLHVLSESFEQVPASTADRSAMKSALIRFAEGVQLTLQQRASS